MKRLLYSVLWITGLLFCSVSCMEEQDFDQIDDLSVTPTLASGIFYLESDEETINSVATGSFYSEEFTFEAFNEQYVAERLIEGTITYELDNTTSKDLRIVVEFLDEDGRVLDIERFDIEADPSETLIREVFYGPSGKPIDILANTTGLRVSAVNLSDNTSISPAENPSLILRSGAEFLFRLQ
ncbi:hypothetical protein K1F50_11685 [Muricauda oceani]|uniref:Uncharacterized protein n=1 Tax=Flagellimonas oceani TaxID=2698672 RepID=A0A6G7J476_9FLAO|nr:hypothetical protein [Allomuricauda oceani]MBW8243465.1 hypothetical protein [Allomuricauda oceani]QII45681.1 hypothetical protein GVT53_13665 [Allomuricauda oceani]